MRGGIVGKVSIGKEEEEDVGEGKGEISEGLVRKRRGSERRGIMGEEEK